MSSELGQYHQTAVEHVRVKSLRLAATEEFAKVGGFLTVG